MPRSGWLALGGAAAALAAAGDDPLVLAVVVVAAGLTFVGALWVPRRRAGIPIAFAMGLLVLSARTVAGPSAAVMAGTPEGSGPWTMAVETVGSPRDGQQVATLRSTMPGPGAFRVAATLPRYPQIEPGDRIEVGGRTRPRPDSPYGQYLARLDAWGTLDARSMTLLARPTDPGTILESSRRDAGDLLTRVLPEPEAGLAAGILIGLRDRVDRDVAAAFTTAGVSHVVAISGWNIAIVAAAIGALAGRLGRRRRSIVTAAAIVVYIAFAGASPSVLRAGAMAGVVLFARESGRSGRAAAALGWAAFLLLLADPALVGDAGFQLSTLATAGLIAWATPLTDRIERLGRGRLPRWLAESLGISLAAQAATLPIVLASFGRLAVISPAVNLLVVPIVAPAMAAGIVALAGGLLVTLGAPGVVGAVLAAPGWVALRLMIGIVEVAAGVPLASVAFEPPVGVALGAITLVVGGFVMAWRRGSLGRRGGAARPSTSRDPTASTARAPVRRSMTGRLATIGLVVAIAVTTAVAVTRPAGVARVTVLDVGQGDAILVEGSRGGRLLIDGGPDPDRLLVELDRRIPPWDRRIDVVILSHPHEDHVAGLALLMARYRITRVMEPGMRGPGPGYAAWLDRLALPGAPIRTSVAAGDRLAVDEITMRVLWPIRGEVPSEPADSGTGINNVSVVLLGAVGQRRFLLAGDIEEEVDPELLFAGLPPVDLLKVAHHGSRTATTDAFVAAVRPRIAVASAGADNSYGHPARSTMDRLAAAGARVYRTDRDGTVTVAFEAGGVAIRTEPRRGAAARPTVPAPAASAVQAASAGPTGPQRSFACALPVLADTAETADPPAPAPAPDVAPDFDRATVGALATSRSVAIGSEPKSRATTVEPLEPGRSEVVIPATRPTRSRPRECVSRSAYPWRADPCLLLSCVSRGPPRLSRASLTGSRLRVGSRRRADRADRRSR